MGGPSPGQASTYLILVFDHSGSSNIRYRGLGGVEGQVVPIL